MALMRNIKFGGAALLSLTASTPGWAQTAEDPTCFARILPENIRVGRLDDIKLLIGWVFDAAAAHHALASGDIIDRHSTLSKVPGFAGATDLSRLMGRYRVVRAPFDEGNGYFGVELGALEPDGHVSGLFLVNRLFRLPLLLQQPAGVATDIVTNGAMLAGWKTQAITDANHAAAIALTDAERLNVPLLTTGQSQAGGTAQLQAAYLANTKPGRLVSTGFVTLNAAYVVSSVRRLGIAPSAVGGINFTNDLDPGFGPHGLLPNKIGLQVYIHPDGTGTKAAGDQTFFAALRHPGQHLLSSFNAISLTNALASALKSSLERCARPT